MPPTFSAWSPARPTSSPPPTDTALVITGAVAQGAFAAGALDVLTRDERARPIARIVATSAGALSGTLLAAGIRGGRLADAAAALVEHWTEDATWPNALRPSARALLRGRGLSTTGKLHGILRRAIPPFVPGAQRPIELHLIVTALAGDPATRDHEHVSAFESVQRFTGEDFDTAERREHIYTAATAAAAFPGLYAPVHVAGLGACLDGGITNNAPIGHALDGCALGRVIVISNTPAVVDPPPPRGVALVQHVAEILTHERLHRDLRAARHRNQQLAALDQLGRAGTLTAQQLAAVSDALGWQAARRIDLLEIRPPVALRGGAFGALGDRALRVEYVAEGRRAAERALAAAAARADRTTHTTPAARPSR